MRILKADYPITRACPNCNFHGKRTSHVFIIDVINTTHHSVMMTKLDRGQKQPPSPFLLVTPLSSAISKSINFLGCALHLEPAPPSPPPSPLSPGTGLARRKCAVSRVDDPPTRYNVNVLLELSQALIV